MFTVEPGRWITRNGRPLFAVMLNSDRAGWEEFGAIRSGSDRRGDMRSPERGHAEGRAMSLLAIGWAVAAVWHVLRGAWGWAALSCTLAVVCAGMIL